MLHVCLWMHLLALICLSVQYKKFTLHHCSNGMVQILKPTHFL
ncbi:Uncharacterised protein [Vibrio cholerae]|nr:Uncharacterised protein [Vibrio cholerae]